MFIWTHSRSTFLLSSTLSGSFLHHPRTQISVWWKSGLYVLPKDTSTCGLERPPAAGTALPQCDFILVLRTTLDQDLTSSLLVQKERLKVKKRKMKSLMHELSVHYGRTTDLCGPRGWLWIRGVRRHQWSVVTVLSPPVPADRYQLSCPAMYCHDCTKGHFKGTYLCEHGYFRHSPLAAEICCFNAISAISHPQQKLQVCSLSAVCLLYYLLWRYLCALVIISEQYDGPSK